MHDFSRVTFALQFAANYFGQRDGTMAATGATERYREITFAFCNVVRDQIQQQALDAAQEFARLREGTDVARDAGILAAEWTQARHEMRVGQKAHVEDEIGVRRNAIAKAEADDR